MARLSETNPELFENPTLGEATTSPFLDQVEEQKKEDFNARHEGREPRTVLALNRIPGKFIPSESVPSDYSEQLAYEGEDSLIGEAPPVDENEVSESSDPESPVEETPVEETSPITDTPEDNQNGSDLPDGYRF